MNCHQGNETQNWISKGECENGLDERLLSTTLVSDSSPGNGPYPKNSSKGVQYTAVATEDNREPHFILQNKNLSRNVQDGLVLGSTQSICSIDSNIQVSVLCYPRLGGTWTPGRLISPPHTFRQVFPAITLNAKSFQVRIVGAKLFLNCKARYLLKTCSLKSCQFSSKIDLKIRL